MAGYAWQDSPPQEIHCPACRGRISLRWPITFRLAVRVRPDIGGTGPTEQSVTMWHNCRDGRRTLVEIAFRGPCCHRDQMDRAA